MYPGREKDIEDNTEEGMIVWTLTKHISTNDMRTEKAIDKTRRKKTKQAVGRAVSAPGAFEELPLAVAAVGRLFVRGDASYELAREDPHLL